jgi:hypothetical protein
MAVPVMMPVVAMVFFLLLGERNRGQEREQSRDKKDLFHMLIILFTKVFILPGPPAGNDPLNN